MRRFLPGIQSAEFGFNRIPPVDSSSLDLETILFLLYVFTVPVKIPMTTLIGNGLNLVDSSPVTLVCQGISPICLDNPP